MLRHNKQKNSYKFDRLIVTRLNTPVFYDYEANCFKKKANRIGSIKYSEQKVKS
jgi:hypothetical protein